MTLRCLSVVPPSPPCRFLDLLHFLSVVSGEGEVILAQLFLILIVLHCVKRVILTNSTFLQCQDVRALIAFLEAASVS